MINLTVKIKNILTILAISFSSKIIWKISEEEMLIRIQLTTLFQIFCKFKLNSKVVLKSVIDPDYICEGDLQA